VKPGDIVYSVVPVLCFTSLTGNRKLGFVTGNRKLGFVGAEVFVGVIVDFDEGEKEEFTTDNQRGFWVHRVLTCINGETQYIYVYRSQLRRTPPKVFLEEEAKRRANLQ
jgi:hypothetical protein